MAKFYGKCALCGKDCELTFEHIPPRAAFNSSPARPVTGQWMISDIQRMPWDTTGLPYENQQQGMGRYSLCRECNSNTGSWYGNAYIHFSRVVHSFLVNDLNKNPQGLGIREVYPLQFIKQVLSMFCSINNFPDNRIDGLRKFVRNKDQTSLDKDKYKLCMYFTKSHLMKYAPLSVVIKKTDAGVESMAVSEITAYPLGFILYFSPTSTWTYDGIDITSFSDCSYDHSYTVELPICVNEVNDLLPTYYRTKEEIKACIEENRKWVDSHKANN